MNHLRFLDGKIKIPENIVYPRIDAEGVWASLLILLRTHVDVLWMTSDPE